MNSCRVSSHFCPVLGEESDGGLPLGCARADLAHEAVQVRDEALQDLPQPGVGGVGEAVDHGGGRGVFGEVHRVAQSRRSRSALPWAILARSASLIGASRRNLVATSISSNG